MKCTIINPYRGQFCYARISLDEVYNLIKDGSLRPDPRIAPNKQICFSAEWRRSNGQTHLINNNHLVLLADAFTHLAMSIRKPAKASFTR